MLFKMWSAICFNLDHSKILSFGNGLIVQNMELASMNTTFYQTFNPFPKKPWFLCVCCRSLIKTLWEKEKLLPQFGELCTIFVKFKLSFNLEESKICGLGKG